MAQRKPEAGMKQAMTPPPPAPSETPGKEREARSPCWACAIQQGQLEKEKAVSSLWKHWLPGRGPFERLALLGPGGPSHAHTQGVPPKAEPHLYKGSGAVPGEPGRLKPAAAAKF